MVGSKCAVPVMCSSWTLCSGLVTIFLLGHACATLEEVPHQPQPNDQQDKQYELAMDLLK